MQDALRIKVGVLRKSEVEEAVRVMKMAFGTFLGLADPIAFLGDQDIFRPRWRSAHVKVLAARDGDRLLGTNVITRWGSFGFFGPLSVLPECWNGGVAQALMAETVKVFEKWGVRWSGLYTFANSTKHVGLYQKFGYWPRYLTAGLTWTPVVTQTRPAMMPVLLSGLKKAERELAIAACARLTDRIDKGLDLTGEIRETLKQKCGDVVLVYSRGTLDGFAVCLQGAGSEGGEKICYLKFGAVHGGVGVEKRFERLLEAGEGFALARGAVLEVGVNMASVGAYEAMRARGYRVTMQGVAMQRPATVWVSSGRLFCVGRLALRVLLCRLVYLQRVSGGSGSSRVWNWHAQG